MHIYKKINALGSEVEIYLQSKTDLSFTEDLLHLEILISKFENKFSRFKNDSELSLLNNSGEAFSASKELIDILILAKFFYEKTSGIFDPTILKNLEGYGYNKSFLAQDFNKGKIDLKKENINFGRVIIKQDEKTVLLPRDLKIDLGGIGKGYIVDVLSSVLKNKAYKNFWVSAGGDMHLSGVSEDGNCFQVAIQDPLNLEEDIFYLKVNEELSVATSGIAKRKWEKQGKNYHHIIDPRTALPADNKILAVTVVSNHTVKADIYAKTVLILGREAGLAFIDNQQDAEALIIEEGLQFSFSKNMFKYLINK